MKIGIFMTKYGSLITSLLMICVPVLIYFVGIPYQIENLKNSLQEDHDLFLRDLNNKSLVTKIKIDDLSSDLGKTNESLLLINKRLDGLVDAQIKANKNTDQRLDNILLRVSNHDG